MLTMKFGGTSMGSAKMIAAVADIIIEQKKNGRNPIAVVSAMSGVTNQLLRASKLAIKNTAEAKAEQQKIINSLRFQHLETAKKLVKDTYLYNKIDTQIHEMMDHFVSFLDAISIIRELSALSHDEIISLGEKLSAALLAAHINDKKMAAQYIDLSYIINGESFEDIGSEFFDYVEEKLKGVVSPVLEAKKIPVLTGFFGRIPGGIINAVGRGYSDFTAAISGAAFAVKEIQIWTDVDGLLSADPRLVKYTCTLPEVSFDEAGELAQFGAKVLHPQTVWPAVKKNIPVRIKNTMNPNVIGTLITRDGAKGNYLCKSVASKKGITAIMLTSSRMLMAVGFLAKVFEILARYNISVDFISTGEISVTLTFNRNFDDIPKTAIEELQKVAKVDVIKHQALICAVGTELAHRHRAAATIFKALGDSNISVRGISQSTQEINISILVNEADAEIALLALHKEIFEN